MGSDGLAVLIVFGFVVAGCLTAGVWTYLDRREALRKRIGEWVIVQLDVTTLRGVLTDVTADSLVLRHAAEVVESAALSMGDDEAIVPRSRVVYVQHGPAVVRDATGVLGGQIPDRTA